MHITEVNGIKIYELSSGTAIPEYLGKRRQQNLKAKHKKSTLQLEIIHNLSMPDITTSMSFTPDGKYMFLLGAYSPRIRCYELEQLSMKFERNADELPSKVVHIEDDYSKFVVLEGHKTLSFHASGGIYHKARCDNVIRDLSYSSVLNKFFIAHVNEISLFDLQIGRHFSVFESNNLSQNICSAYNQITNMYVTGTDNGFINIYDYRTALRSAQVDIRKASMTEYMKKSYVPQVCKMVFKDPLKIGVGTDKGIFLLYDIRNISRPLSSRDLDYEYPIKSIIFHEEKVIAAVKCVFKIWEPIEGEEGNIIASYDTNTDISDFCQYPNSGLFFSASNNPKIDTFFIPKIADAPGWCQHLSNLIVDVETESQSMYDTHIFVTREELDELKLDSLIDKGLLRAYMHGYYVSKETFNRAKNALLVSKAREEEKLLANKENPRYKFVTPSDPLDDIPDPRINVELKSLIKDKRYADLFTRDIFKLNPTCKAYEQVSIDLKHLAKKRNKKLLLQKQAKKSKSMADNLSEEDE